MSLRFARRCFVSPRFGGATSAVPGEGSPRAFYERYGFVATGEVVDEEDVLRLDLR